jgi:hypothetical protein
MTRISGFKLGLIGILISLFLIQGVAAATNIYWTPIFNTDGGAAGTDYSHYNTSTQLQSVVAPNSTPWEFFWAAGLIALGLFLLTLLRPQQTAMDQEINGIISVLAWAPAAFCSFAAFNIDRIVGYGVTSQIANVTTQAQATFNNHEYVYMENHLTYSEPLIGLCMIVFTFICVANTFRIVAQHRALKLSQENADD